MNANYLIVALLAGTLCLTGCTPRYVAEETLDALRLARVLDSSSTQGSSRWAMPAGTRLGVLVASSEPPLNPSDQLIVNAARRAFPDAVAVASGGWSEVDLVLDVLVADPHLPEPAPDAGRWARWSSEVLTALPRLRGTDMLEVRLIAAPSGYVVRNDRVSVTPWLLASHRGDVERFERALAGYLRSQVNEF